MWPAAIVAGSGPRLSSGRMRLSTSRTVTNVLESGDPAGVPVVFVHGNVSSSVFWARTMARLPAGYRALAPDLRGFGDSDPAPVDATRGLRDFSDDLLALLDALEVESAHFVGWSLGGGAVLQLLVDAPARVRSLTLVDPVSPLGFGEYAPGAGCVHPDFLERLASGDTSADSPLSPRNVLLAHYVRPGFVPEDLDLLVAGMLTTVIGEDNYPGDVVPSPEPPGFVPGTRGVINALAPRYFRIESLAAVDPTPPILWIRGSDDVIVSDASLYDLAEGAAKQPMVRQMREVLRTYRGRWEETVIAHSGHGPHLDRPAEFDAALHRWLE